MKLQKGEKKNKYIYYCEKNIHSTFMQINNGDHNLNIKEYRSIASSYLINTVWTQITNVAYTFSQDNK